MKPKYKQIQLTSVKAFKQAERLQAQGWKIINVGLTTILMEKKGI